MPKIPQRTRNEYLLMGRIIELSVADDWPGAKTEWSLRDVYYQPGGACLCGHTPITEHCVLVNRINGAEAIVGNCCVKKFLGLGSDKLFAAIARVKDDASKALNPETLEHAARKGWLTEWELRFYCDTLRKRRPSARQLAKRREINEKVLSFIEAEAR